MHPAVRLTVDTCRKHANDDGVSTAVLRSTKAARTISCASGPQQLWQSLESTKLLRCLPGVRNGASDT